MEKPILFSRPSIDVLFKSAAEIYGESLVGILLSGANKDGALGLKQIKETGGIAIVQNPISAEMSEMPSAGMAFASPECVLSLDKIAQFLDKLNDDSPNETIVQNFPKTDKLEILIVDDVRDNLLALNALLERDDVSILKAQSGAQALELMLKHDFCLALLDVRMPEMNGFELAELMRGTSKTKNIPIIFVTADTKDQTHIFKGYESGAVDFLRKPLDAHSVTSKVNIFLEIYQQKKELSKQVKWLKEIRDHQEKLLIELNKTKEALEQATRTREEFMAIAVHELSMPLLNLKKEAKKRKQNIENGQTYTTPELAQIFEFDICQLERLTQQFDDMLDISRLTSGQLSLNLEFFDLCSLIHDIVEIKLKLFLEAGIHVTLNSYESINGNWDKFRIEQAINNLLTNVIQYAPGNPLTISISQQLEHAIIVIEDKGKGIEKADLSRIFERFERATQTEISGLGLGLFIVKKIIEAHHGSIKLESQVGLGSSFIINLPMSLS
jgi:signal transduction histidine kinase